MLLMKPRLRAVAAKGVHSFGGCRIEGSEFEAMGYDPAGGLDTAVSHWERGTVSSWTVQSTAGWVQGFASLGSLDWVEQAGASLLSTLSQRLRSGEW